MDLFASVCVVALESSFDIVVLKEITSHPSILTKYVVYFSQNTKGPHGDVFHVTNWSRYYIESSLFFHIYLPKLPLTQTKEKAKRKRFAFIIESDRPINQSDDGTGGGFESPQREPPAFLHRGCPSSDHLRARGSEPDETSSRNQTPWPCALLALAQQTRPVPRAQSGRPHPAHAPERNTGHARARSGS